MTVGPAQGAARPAEGARSRRSWVIAGGGTGGHVMPVLALAERIDARGDQVLCLGSAHGLEARLVPEAGFELRTLPARPLMGSGLLARGGATFMLALGALVAVGILLSRRPHIVISVGGYASAPAVVAATLLRIPLVLIEPNARPGRTNRVAARVARRIYLAFEGARGAIAAPDDRIEVSGVPLRRALVDAFAAEASRRTPEKPLRLLVFGGSQGARQLNEAMMAAASQLDAKAIEVFHQTGEADRERVAEAYLEAGLSGEVVAFEPDMGSRYRWADLALARAGALTVAELTLAGLPALLVPYPHAADDHQRANARELERHGAAICIDPSELDGATLAEHLNALGDAPERLVSMGRASAGLARRDAADRIIADCIAAIDGGV